MCGLKIYFFMLGYNVNSIRFWEGPKNKNTMSGQCNKPKFKRDKLGYNSN